MAGIVLTGQWDTDSRVKVVLVASGPHGRLSPLSRLSLSSAWGQTFETRLHQCRVAFVIKPFVDIC